MAMVLAAVGTAVTWVGTTAAAISASASFYLASVTGMSWVAAGTVVSAVSQLALSAATTALMTPNVGRGGSPIAFKADPSAPISGVMGRFGVGGRQLHANVWGKDNLYLSFAVALSLGPIQSVEGFTASGTAVTFPGAQGLAAATEPYINKMWQTYRLGLPTDAYLSPPTGVSDGSPAMTEWTSAHTLPGFAQTFWTMKNNSKREGYQSGVPAPLWTLLGMKVWDPRLDSTYPGGSGSQRRTDWSTWTYSANPYLHALAWVRGHHKLVAGGTIDLTKRLAGVGAPDAAIDIAAFVEGANVADANSWTISGEWTTADDKWQTLAAMLQAGGGVPISQGAQISCMVETPRTSLMTVTGADIVGSVSLNVMASRRDRPNTVIPRVRLEAHKFEEVALGAVTSATYLTEDAEEKRVIETSYRFVGVAKQGAELAGYGLANTRETLKASIPCKPYLLGLRAGDAFTVTEPELGLSAQKFVVMRRSFDPSSSIVTLDVRSETDAKHAYALGQSADAPASPSLTAASPVPTTPASGDWTIVARPVEASGVQQPGLIVTGPTISENIGTVLVEYSTSGSGPWVQAYSGPPTIASVEINGLIGGTAYYVGITYWSVRGVPSAQLVKGPYTAPGLTSGDVVPITPGTVAGTPSLSISTSIVADGSQVSRLSGSWTPPANALTYVVEIDNGTVTTQFAAPDASIADRIVTTGPTYRYRVKALSRTGTLSTAWSSWSSNVTAAGDVTPPSAIISGSVAVVGGRRLRVILKRPSNDDYSHSLLYRNTTGVSPDDTPQNPIAEVFGDTYVDVGATVGSSSRYWARSVDRTGNECDTATYLGAATATFITVAGGDVSASDADLVTVNGLTPANLDTANVLRRTSGGLYTGDLAATVGAAWGTNLTGRPTELTDGRITTGLNASGVLQTAIPSALADTSNILRRTAGGLYTGALDANRITNTNELTDGANLGGTAAWGGVSSRPTELTDGRITTALNASGVLQTAIPSALADSSNILRRTAGGLYTGALDANRITNTNELTDGANLGGTAAWSGVSSRPTELTDGRITTALNASGVLQTAIPSALADSSNILRRTGGGLFTGALAATDDSAVTALSATLGPLATSALTEAKVQGRWFGQYAGDSAANTAGLQNGDSYVDTSVYPPVLKGKTGGTIYEISETGILLDTDTDVDLVGTGTTFTDVHSYTLPAAVSTSSFFVIQLGLSIVLGTTVSGSGVTAPSGLWQLWEFDSASTDATKRMVHSGAWDSQIIGAGPNAANLTDITVDGDNYSDISRQWKFKFGGGGILKLRMHQGGGPNLSNARSHIRVTVQRN